MRAVLLLLALALVNLPLAHQWWSDRALDDRGREVRAVVVDSRRVGDSNFVDYRLPRSEDPAQRVYSASLRDEAFREARRTRALDVRMVPGEPGSNKPDGEVPNHLFLAVALGADALFLVIAGIALRRRRDPGHETLQA